MSVIFVGFFMRLTFWNFEDLVVLDFDGLGLQQFQNIVDVLVHQFVQATVVLYKRKEKQFQSHRTSYSDISQNAQASIFPKF